MKNLNDELKSPRTHINIKYLISKLIINTAEVSVYEDRRYCQMECSLKITNIVITLDCIFFDIVNLFDEVRCEMFKKTKRVHKIYKQFARISRYIK